MQTPVKTQRRRLGTEVIVFIFLICMLATAITTALLVRHQFQRNAFSDAKNKNIKEALEKLTEIQGIVDKYFVGEYDTEKVGDILADSLIYAYGDQWSYYVSAADAKAYNDDRQGRYTGIGVTVNFDEQNNELIITEVKENSPAHGAGLRIEDRITAIGGKTIEELGGYYGAVDAVRGEEGTSVGISILRGEASFSVEMIRKIFEINYIYTQMFGDIGYIRLTEFSETVATTLPDIVKDMAENKGATGLVFDVRNNPGGSLNVLLKVLDVFMPECVLFIEEDKSGKRYEYTSDAFSLEIPLTVLCNEYSVSAAEYFSGLLQEYGRATIIGTKTTGKGFGQSTFELSDGSIVAISTIKYYTPQGRSLALTGVVPDIEIEMTDEQIANITKQDPEIDPQLEKAIEIVTGQKSEIEE